MLSSVRSTISSSIPPVPETKRILFSWNLGAVEFIVEGMEDVVDMIGIVVNDVVSVVDVVLVVAEDVVDVVDVVVIVDVVDAVVVVVVVVVVFVVVVVVVVVDFSCEETILQPAGPDSQPLLGFGSVSFLRSKLHVPAAAVYE